MPFDSFGNFTRDYNWTADKLNGIKIESERMDGEFDNYATALNQVLLRSGVTPYQGDLKMGGFKITGLGNGTPASPAVQFLNDPTTGMYLPAPSVVGFSIGGTERFRITATGAKVTGALDFGPAPGMISTGGTPNMYFAANGDVGVGVAPTKRLDVYKAGAATVVEVMARNDAVATVLNADNGRAYIGTLSGHDLHVVTSGLGRLQLTAAGNVGVNVAPLVRFHVEDNVNEIARISRPAANTAAVQAFYTGGGLRGYLGANTANEFAIEAATNLVFTTAGAERMRITSGGRVSLGTDWTGTSQFSVTSAGRAISAYTSGGAGTSAYTGRIDNAAATYMDYYFNATLMGSTTSDGTSMLHSSTSAQVFRPGNAEAVRFLPNGNVGIGTNNPGAPLDIFRPGTATANISVRNASVQTVMVADATASYFGSGSNNPVIFVQSGGEIMRMTATGLGIGITPIMPLDVQGPGRFVQNNTFANGAINLRMSAANGPALIVWLDNANTAIRGYMTCDNTGNMGIAPLGVVSFRLNANGRLADKDDIEIGFKDTPPNFQAATYQLAATDRHKVVVTGGGSAGITINTDALAPGFPLGSRVDILNDSPGVKTITPIAGVTLLLAGSAAPGARTMAVGAYAHLLKIGVNTWYVEGQGVT